ncbi:MAG: hypothetical protein SLAVMIC_00237 [uncultured marine phage]|uniref:Uncharacterized protein n=1 Tax=uncultured marine phage TaxID=707152 RepID=A0A8D9FQW6_9VIRU|nr:MAG: hypothetical protein SLAVMIC_00237 [uncultured marine phage]
MKYLKTFENHGRYQPNVPTDRALEVLRSSNFEQRMVNSPESVSGPSVFVKVDLSLINDIKMKDADETYKGIGDDSLLDDIADVLDNTMGTMGQIEIYVDEDEKSIVILFQDESDINIDEIKSKLS